ncbi:MAG: M20/M25/M40 family metallo-hydrolase [Candidatus Aminicenantes bacterium]|nr:M20/M25/M40 family metallo-hydrolase [Candidatus Aminicenantes bacterium]
MRRFRTPVLALILALSFGLTAAGPALAQRANPSASPKTDEQKLLEAMHLIQSGTLYDYVKEMVSEKYGGRLTGTPEYRACAEWIVSLLKSWGVQPGGDNGTFYQTFANPYTIVSPGGYLTMDVPVRDGVIKKSYKYEDEFIPGGTSGSGEVTAEVIFVGFGVTAPELGYDDYAGIDVKGKIVLMDPEVPLRADDSAAFKKWRPYSFHQYKLENAVAHGAKGMIYNYGPIGNPNNAYHEGFVYHHVGAAVTADVFAGTGRKYGETMAAIRKDLKPRSFATGKTMSLKNVTVHHPDGIGFNVVGVIPGTDPKLKDEVIMLGAHLDHLGRLWELMPGANDNATAVAVGLGVAEAIGNCEIKPKRTIVFNFFGSEEQGVRGSKYYVEHPLYPLDKTLVLINMEGPGAGEKIGASGATTYPAFWAFIEKANASYIHRIVSGGGTGYPGRPRQDSAWFYWAGVPALTFGADGGKPVPYPTYHNTRDALNLVTPEIMEDMAQLFFMAVMDMADEPVLNFRVN